MKTSLLECCLFFTANSLARAISRLGEEEFAGVSMTPSYAFLVTLAVEQPGINQKELAALLHIRPSTVSRFVDTLIGKGFLEKKVEGRNTSIYPTEAGIAMKPKIEKAWRNLYERYCKILGEKDAVSLTELTVAASRKLQNS